MDRQRILTPFAHTSTLLVLSSFLGIVEVTSDPWQGQHYPQPLLSFQSIRCEYYGREV